MSNTKKKEKVYRTIGKRVLKHLEAEFLMRGIKDVSFTFRKAKLTNNRSTNILLYKDYYILTIQLPSPAPPYKIYDVVDLTGKDIEGYRKFYHNRVVLVEQVFDRHLKILK